MEPPNFEPIIERIIEIELAAKDQNFDFEETEQDERDFADKEGQWKLDEIFQGIAPLLLLDLKHAELLLGVSSILCFGLVHCTDSVHSHLITKNIRPSTSTQIVRSPVFTHSTVTPHTQVQGT